MQSTWSGNNPRSRCFLIPKIVKRSVATLADMQTPLRTDDYKYVMPAAVTLLARKFAKDGLDRSSLIVAPGGFKFYLSGTWTEEMKFVSTMSKKPKRPLEPYLPSFLRDVKWQKATSLISGGLKYVDWLYELADRIQETTFQDYYELFLSEERTQYPAHIDGSTVWYFDANNTYTSITISEAEDAGIVLPERVGEYAIVEGFGDRAAWRRAIEGFQAGMSLQDCLHRFLFPRFYN